MTTTCQNFLLLLNIASEAETEALGRRIADQLRPGDTVALSGGLGAGKTALARAIVRRFLPNEEVPSPTFTLVQTYEAPALRITHADLYRLKAPGEVVELGLDEALEGGVLLIEWPDRMGELLPRDRLDISFELEDSVSERLLKIVARGSWVGRVDKLK